MNEFLGCVNVQMSRFCFQTVAESVVKHRELFAEARNIRDRLSNFHETVVADRANAETAEADVAAARNFTQRARRLLTEVRLSSTVDLYHRAGCHRHHRHFLLSGIK